MNRKILVPLDGSELSERALHYARTPAARIGAEVILLHVCSPEECHCEAEKCTVQPMHRVYVEHTAQMFRNSLEAVAANKIEIGSEILVGEPVTQIVNYAREQNVDRIIMASHGRSGAGRWVLGSIADKVARESPVPVVIIRASAEEAERSDLPDSKILVLLDGSDMAEQVLPFVIEHAKMSGREVVVLRVCEPPDIESPFFYHLTRLEYPPTKPLKWEDFVEEVMAKCKDETKTYLEGIEKRLKEEGVEVSSEVLVGKPSDEIVDYIGKHSFNLIAMSTHGRSGITRWAYGSVADRVLHSATSPLFLVRPGQAERGTA